MVPANSPVIDRSLGAPHAVQVIGQPSCWSVGMTNADSRVQFNRGIMKSHHSRRPRGGGVSSTFHCV